MEPSNAATAMVGLELADPARVGVAPFVSGSLGVGRLSIGDMNSAQMSGATITRHTEAELAPAFSMGLGIRTPSTSTGLRAAFAIRWVGVLTDGGLMNIVPFTIGVAF
jgi:hypothetical protein